MSPGGVLKVAAERRKTLVHYAPDPGDVADRFVARNVDVTFRRLPPGGPDPFVVVRDDTGFRGAVTVATLESVLSPPGAGTDGRTTVPPVDDALLGLLDDTVFASLSRRQLLATSREFEDRAWRAGRGVLHAGFQTAAAFEPRRSLYRRLGTETDLNVHVHVADDDIDDDGDNGFDDAVTVHQGGEDVARYWFVVFDGPGDSQCALVAEQRDENDYVGAWTYDSGLVAGVLADLPAADAQ